MEIINNSNNNNEDYKRLITEVIQKQAVILGPDIALMKARNVSDLKIAEDGAVITISGDPQIVLQKLVDEYVSLSGLIVRKAMEPLLSKYPGVRVPR